MESAGSPSPTAAGSETRFKPFKRSTAEEKAQKQVQKQSEKEAKARQKLRKAFFASPAGKARRAFEEGAHVFQYEANVKSTKAVVSVMGLGSTKGTESWSSRLQHGPVPTLNAVCNEGWELLNGSFVFVETGMQSRNRALATGQQSAVSGDVVGYYLFKRNEANKKDLPDPWDAPTEQAVELAEQVEGE